MHAVAWPNVTSARPSDAFDQPILAVIRWRKTNSWVWHAQTIQRAEEFYRVLQARDRLGPIAVQPPTLAKLPQEFGLRLKTGAIDQSMARGRRRRRHDFCRRQQCQRIEGQGGCAFHC